MKKEIYMWKELIDQKLTNKAINKKRLTNKKLTKNTKKINSL